MCCVRSLTRPTLGFLGMFLWIVPCVGPLFGRCDFSPLTSLSLALGSCYSKSQSIPRAVPFKQNSLWDFSVHG